MNGIHHGDISFNNLMYGTPTETGGPVGIVNDFDLATWVNHSTTNNDRTGTIPFMAIDLLEGGYDKGAPRLYRHDLESFVWVLTYITVAKVEYEGHTIKISPLPNVDTWFIDRDYADRLVHTSSKRHLQLGYGSAQQVSGRYSCYSKVIREMIRYWGDFHSKYIVQPKLPIPTTQKPIVRESELDDPEGSLRAFIETVEESLGGGGVQEGFVAVKALLLRAIGTPRAT